MGDAGGTDGAPARGDPPPALTTLVGRERERVEVRGLLDEARLVTLVGPGGCGKTRLATELTRDLSTRHAEGVRWVELAAVSEADAVDVTLAAALGIHERPGQALVGALVEHLGDGELLVVLDNCEHLVEACATLVGQLLRGCPRLLVLATSRAPLALEGEVTYPVEPLPQPAPGARTAAAVGSADAPRLFELRARQVDPGFALDDGNAEAVAEICRRLDGIPLAIELAAARARVLAPAQIAAGLSDRFRLLTGGRRDAPSRQRTLEASLAWSYGLLDEEQRLVLARLSVFVGSLDLEAATAVAAGEGNDRQRVLDLVTSLVERSLLQVSVDGGQARYRLLETIRMFAGTKLAAFEDPARVRDRHLDHFVDLARRARAGLVGPEAATWTARLAASVADLHAAMQWAVDSGRPRAVLDIAEPTQRFWLDRGHYSELERRLLAAVDAPGATDADRAQALTTTMLLVVGGGHVPKVHAFADQAVPVSRASGTEAALAVSLAVRSYAGLTSGLASSEEVAADIDEAVALGAELADPADRIHALVYAGSTAFYGRSLDQGRLVLEQIAAICEDAGIRFHRPAAHATLGVWLPFLGEVDLGREHARQGVDWSRRVNRPGWEAVASAGLAVADLLSGDVGPARERLADAEALLHARHLSPSVFERLVGRWSALAACRSGATGDARRVVEATRRSASARGARMDEAWETWLLGLLASTDGRSEEAAGHLEQCRRLSVEPRYPFTLGRALLGLSCLENDVGRAWELAHEGLDVLTAYGDRVGTTDALEVLAGLAVSRDRSDQALRLLAATGRFRAESGVGRAPAEADRVAQAVAGARARTGGDDADTCWADGERLTLDEAVAYARRGRGERDRPEVGWASLTPTEREVVRLVVEGHTNAQIGERLFISPNTVKKHLSGVYARVGADGRAGLAAAAARRGL